MSYIALFYGFVMAFVGVPYFIYASIGYIFWYKKRKVELLALMNSQYNTKAMDDIIDITKQDLQTLSFDDTVKLLNHCALSEGTQVKKGVFSRKLAVLLITILLTWAFTLGTSDVSLDMLDPFAELVASSNLFYTLLALVVTSFADVLHSEMYRHHMEFKFFLSVIFSLLGYCYFFLSDTWVFLQSNLLKLIALGCICVAYLVMYVSFNTKKRGKKEEDSYDGFDIR